VIKTITLICDGCGREGDADEIASDYKYGNQDLCPSCQPNYDIAELKRRIENKKAWLKETHLKDIMEWEAEIKELGEK